MNKNQTAVQWLIENLNKIDRRSLREVLKQQESALQMERNQIEEAFKDGVTGDSESPTGYDYYNKMYKLTNLCNTSNT